MAEPHQELRGCGTHGATLACLGGSTRWAASTSELSRSHAAASRRASQVSSVKKRNIPAETPDRTNGEGGLAFLLLGACGSRLKAVPRGAAFATRRQWETMGTMGDDRRQWETMETMGDNRQQWATMGVNGRQWGQGTSATAAKPFQCKAQHLQSKTQPFQFETKPSQLEAQPL